MERTRWVVLAAILGAMVAVAGNVPTVAQKPQQGDTAFVRPASLSWPDLRYTSFLRQSYLIRRLATERLRIYPESPHTAVWLSQADNLDDALTVLERIIERRPDRLAEGFAHLEESSRFLDESRGYRRRLGELLERAERHLPTFDRERAAATVLALLPLHALADGPRRRDRSNVRDFVAEYQGTRAALLAEVDLVVETRGPASLAALDEFAARHPGTVAAAKARYLRGFDLARNFGNIARTSGNADPTDAFFEVLAIVADLESGRYPPCRWVSEAPELVTGFFIPSTTMVSPRNAERLLAGIRGFAREHLSLLWPDTGSGALDYLITGVMPQVAASLPDATAAIERQFAAFETEWPDLAAVKLLRAEWLDTRADDDSRPMALPPPSDTREAEIRALLAAAAEATTERYARRALARLAEREFADPASHRAAYAHYAEYERRFPAAPDAWVASLRRAQVDQAQGQLADAIAGFARVFRTYADDGFIRALAMAYAGRASEEAGDFAAAASFYRSALEGWSPELGDTLGLDPASVGTSDPAVLVERARRTIFERTDVARRVAELDRSLALGADDLERGRHLLAEGRPGEGVTLLEDVERRYAGSDLAAEARRLYRRARLDFAVAHATAPGGGNAAAMLSDLDALAREPFDVRVGVAGLMAASIRRLYGLHEESDATLSATLRRWVAEGASLRAEPPAGSIEADVLAIRDALFLPLGHEALRYWTPAEWPETLPPFLVAPAVLDAKLPDGTRMAVDVSRLPRGLGNVVFITADDAAWTSQALERLDVAQGRGTGVVEWLNRSFPTRHGHWGGVEILADPWLSSIEFTNVEQTRALVPISVRNSGATVVLEKRNGAWTIVDVVNFWIT